MENDEEIERASFHLIPFFDERKRGRESALRESRADPSGNALSFKGEGKKEKRKWADVVSRGEKTEGRYIKKKKSDAPSVVATKEKGGERKR